MARYRNVIALMLASLCLVAVTELAQAGNLSSNYSYATAFTNQHSMLRMTDGTLAFMYQKGLPAGTTNGLVLMISEDSGTTWTQVLQVAALPNVFPDLVQGPGRSLYVVYSINDDGPGTNRDARFAKVEYNAAAGTWSVTRTSFIFDADSTNGAFNAVMAKENNLFWCAFRYFAAGNYSERLYVSSDEGSTWSYVMEVDTPGPSTDETAVLAQFGSKLALIYYHQDSQFRWRVRDIGAPTNAWGPSQLIHQMTGQLGSKSGFSVLTDDNNQLHLIFGDSGIKHCRTTGGIWGATPIVVSTLGYAPELATNGRDLWGVWEEPVGFNQNTLVLQKYDATAGTWDPSRIYFNNPSERLPASTLCYSAMAGTWSDVTGASGNGINNDVVNATTLGTLRDPGDALYVGMPAPFSYLYVLLNTFGVGGDAIWEYWNGSAWTTFVPLSGPYTFSNNREQRLWPNIGQGPADWAPVSVHGSPSLYYVRATATASFTTPPRVTQVTSHERNRFATVAPRDPAGLTLAWTRGTSAPFTVEMRGTIPWVNLGGPAPVLAVGGANPGFALDQNRPNPFNPSTTIRFSLAKSGPVRLTVYDVRGGSIARLAEGVYPAGAHEVVWDGKARSGAAAASGVYWYRLEVNGVGATRRMILLP